jgi:hypothetical protein
MDSVAILAPPVRHRGAACQLQHIAVPTPHHPGFVAHWGEHVSPAQHSAACQLKTPKGDEQKAVQHG